MSFSRCLAVVCAGATLSFAVAGTNPVGTWSGHVQLSMPHANAQQQQQMAQAKAMMAKMKISLTLKKDHTFVSSQSGGPMGPRSDGGKWTLSGNDLTLTGGKSPAQAQHFMLSKDGHSMKLDNSKIPGLSVTFTR